MRINIVYCRLLGPFYINYKSRVHQSYHLLVIVMFIFLSERLSILSIALSPQCPVCQGGHYTSPSVGTLSWIQQCVMVMVIVNVKNKSWALSLLVVCMTKDATIARPCRGSRPGPGTCGTRAAAREC